MLATFTYTIFIAITAFTYSYILTQPNEIFGKLYGIFNTLFKTDKRISAGKGVHPLFKMIMWCEKCVSGQMALWIFLAFHYNYYLINLSLAIQTLITHIIFIGTTIFLTVIIKSIYIKKIE